MVIFNSRTHDDTINHNFMNLQELDITRDYPE